jgi:hypothetical protein
VAPRSKDIEAFERHLESKESWLRPYDGFGPSNVLVGQPDFDFADYTPWIEARFPPSRFSQITEKMDMPTLFAIAAFVQALGQNPGLEQVLQELGSQAHVYVGTGLGELGTIESGSLQLHRAQRRWDRFWAAPERNEALRRFLAGEGAPEGAAPPVDPATLPDEDREEIEEQWWHFWAGHSLPLREFLAEMRDIESLAVQGTVETGKLGLIKESSGAQPDAQDLACPPPWREVPATCCGTSTTHRRRRSR